MKCARWEERLALAVEGDAPLPEEHLAGCASCREFLAALEQSQAAVKALGGEPVDAAALDAVRGRVMAQVAGERPSFGWWRVWVPAAACAAAMAAFMLWPREPVPQPKAVAAVIPPAPPAPRIVWAKHVPRLVAHKAPQPTEPLLMRIVTDDPNITIYWIVEGRKGD